jgi:hypothetical protein
MNKDSKIYQFNFISPITNFLHGGYVHGGDLQISGVFSGFLSLSSGICSDFVIHSIHLIDIYGNTCDFMPVYLKGKEDVSECWIDDACDAHCKKTFPKVVEVVEQKDFSDVFNAIADIIRPVNPPAYEYSEKDKRHITYDDLRNRELNNI